MVLTIKQLICHHMRHHLTNDLKFSYKSIRTTKIVNNESNDHKFYIDINGTNINHNSNHEFSQIITNLLSKVSAFWELHSMFIPKTSLNAFLITTKAIIHYTNPFGDQSITGWLDSWIRSQDTVGHRRPVLCDGWSPPIDPQKHISFTQTYVSHKNSN